MPRARVLLVDLQGIMGDIVANLLRGEADCEIVGELRERAGLVEAVRQRRPDLVVIPLRDTDLGPNWDGLFAEFPSLRVMAVTRDGRRACLFTEPFEDDPLAGFRNSEVPERRRPMGVPRPAGRRPEHSSGTGGDDR